MGLLDTWQEWKNRYSPNKEDRESLQTAGGRPGLRIGMQGYQAPDNAYTGLAPDQRDRLGRVTKERVSVAPLPARDRLGRPYPKDAQGNLITPSTRATALAKKQTADAPTNKVYRDAIMRGGKGANIPQDLNWWQKLSGMFNSKFDLEGAKADWNKKGGFEGLMSNPAFTMGLAFMQAGAEGKTLGAGALDNVMKAAGISSHYKKIIESRKQEPIQATSADIDEVKGLLKSIGVEEGNIFEKVWSKVTGQGNQQMKFDLAAEEIAVQFQKEVRDWQANNKYPDGTPKIIRSDDKIRILKKLIKDKKVKFKESWLSKIGITAATVEKEYPKLKNYAQGGQIQKGQPAIVGEGGPEYFLPQESGKIISNDDSRIFAMLLSANPQLQNVSRTRAEKILRNRFPEYFE